MPNLLAHLEAGERKRLLEDLNYLNLSEMRGFCRAHGIPTAIFVESADGQRTRTRDSDRKSVVLERVRSYLRTGKVPPPTCFPARVVSPDPPPQRMTARTRLYYGWYDKSHAPLIDRLRKLTDGAFRSGAIARILCREFWSKGEAPTLSEFANAWLEENARGLGVAQGRHPEAAWLTDRAKGTAGRDWKQVRARKAEGALKLLSTISPRG